MISNKNLSLTHSSFANFLEKNIIQCFQRKLLKGEQNSFYQSNLWKIKHCKNIQQFASDLTQIFIHHLETKQQLAFFENLSSIVHNKIYHQLTNIFQKHCVSFQSVKKNNLCFCGKKISQDELQSFCLTCEKTYHQSCMFEKQQAQVNCPVCRIISLDPFSKLIYPIKFGVINQKKEIFSYKVNEFALQQNQHIEIRSMKILPGKRHNNHFAWPDSCDILVNDLQIVSLSPLAHNSVFRQRQDKAIRLVNCFNKNKIEIRSTRRYNKRRFKTSDCAFVIAILIVKGLTVNEAVTESLKRQPHKIIYYCQITNRFSSNDSGLQILKQKVGVMCPITRERISIPAKGSECHHLECFDLVNFLKVNSTSRLFRCPIMGCSARCHTFVVDQYMYKCLKQDESEALQWFEFSKDGIFVNKNSQKKTTIQLSSSDEEIDEEIDKRQAVVETLLNPKKHNYFLRNKIFNEKNKIQTMKLRSETKKQIKLNTLSIPHITSKNELSLLFQKHTEQFYEYQDLILSETSLLQNSQPPLIPELPSSQDSPPISPEPDCQSISLNPQIKLTKTEQIWISKSYQVLSDDQVRIMQVQQCQEYLKKEVIASLENHHKALNCPYSDKSRKNNQAAVTGIYKQLFSSVSSNFVT